MIFICIVCLSCRQSFSGATVQDMEDYVKPIARNELDRIILHIGTNNLKSQETSRQIAEDIVNLGTQ